jgi:putative FmdB family regulatory protein
VTYEYKCRKCEATWEAEQKITDKPLTHCPDCGAEAAQRLISSKGAFVLNGEGWFRTGGY